MKILDKSIERYVAFSGRHPIALLLGFICLTAVGVYGAMNLDVNTNLRTLLPDGTPSVMALEESQERRGSSDLYTIAVQSPSARANVALIEELAARIGSEWEEVVWIQIDQDPSFFREHALLYLRTERLEGFLDDLKTALRCELEANNPLFVELTDRCDGVETDWNFEGFLGDGLERELGLPDGFFGDWNDIIESTATDSEDQTEPEGDPDQTEPTDEPQGDDEAEEEVGLPKDLEHYIISEDGQVAVMYVQLSQPSTDIDFATEIRDRGQALIEEVAPLSYHDDMRAEVVGAFRAMQEATEAVSDSTKALFASLAMVVLLIIGFFRAFRGLIVVVIPLSMGLAWSLGTAFLIYGELNMYSLFVASVLAGMGIDFGIHLYGRAMEFFKDGDDWQGALSKSLKHTGPALAAAAATTIAALCTLVISHFRGFQEFGVIAAVGIAYCMLAAYVVTPPLVWLGERIWPLKRRARAKKDNLQLLAQGASLCALGFGAAALVFPWHLAGDAYYAALRGGYATPIRLLVLIPIFAAGVFGVFGRDKLNPARARSILGLGIFGAALWQLAMLQPRIAPEWCPIVHMGDYPYINQTGTWLALAAACFAALAGLVLVIKTSEKIQKRTWAWVFVLVGVLAGFNAFVAPLAEFEYDFRNLRGPSSGSGIRYGRAVGRGRNTSPSIILGETEQQMRQVHELLIHRFNVENDPMLKGFVTIETYVPRHQGPRLAIVEEVHAYVNRRAMNRLRGEAADFVELVRELSDVECAPWHFLWIDNWCFTTPDIPSWAIRTLTEEDGRVGAMGLLYRNLEEWNVREVEVFQSRFAVLPVESGDVQLADATFITSDVIATVQDDGRRMAKLAGIILLGILLLSLRSIRGALICVVTMAGGFAICLGLMVATNTKVGMWNMLVVPAVLGVSIDGAIHIYHRFRENGRKDMGAVLKTTGFAVAAASLTTAGGFAGLLFQQHMGVRSIGELALIGIVSALVAVFFIMPGLLMLFGPRNKALKSADESAENEE